MAQSHGAGGAIVTLWVRGARAKAPSDNPRAWHGHPSGQLLVTLGARKVAVLQLFLSVD
jgi:hypothetical protein